MKTIVLITCLLLCSCAQQRRLCKLELQESYCPEGILEYMTLEGSPGNCAWIYLPKNYYNTHKRYPTVYMLHGARGNDDSWIDQGHLLRCVDSLQRIGLLCECIIVTPDMNSYRNRDEYEKFEVFSPFKAFTSLDGKMETLFMNEVVDRIDCKYRTLREKEYRAIAGLSIGGMQAIHISASYPDSFGYVGLFSPMTYRPIRSRGNSEFYRHLGGKQDKQFSTPPYLYTIMTGRRDLFYGGILRYKERLHKKGYPVTLYISSGGHEWSNWEKYSCMFFRQVFRSEE